MYTVPINLYIFQTKHFYRCNLFTGQEKSDAHLCYVPTVRPVNEWHAIALACTHRPQYLFRYAIVAHAKLYMTS